MADLILAIDQGTTGSSAAFFHADTLEMIAHQKVEFPQIFPSPGWVEHNPEDIWLSVVEAVEKSWKTVESRLPGTQKKNIVALGITNQRETCLAWERNSGETAGNAIVWQDRRTAERCLELRNTAWQEVVRQKTGLVCDPYFSATKMEWLLQNQSKVATWAKTNQLCLGTIDSFLVYRLTNRKAFATDPSNASRTLLFNLHTATWDKELLNLFGIPETALPNVMPSSGNFGMTQGLGFLPDGIPITGILGDQQAALFGQGCTQPGEAKITYGTGAFLLMNTGSKAVPSRSGLLTTVAFGHADGKLSYALEGAAFIAGAAVQFLRDQFRWIASAAEIESLALREERDPNVLFVPALAGLGAPFWNPHAKGALFGLSRGTSQSQIARALLESIALQNAQLLELMQQDSGQRISQVGVDGGAAQNNSLMQFQADSLQTTLLRPSNFETTARGAAAAAVLGWKPTARLPKPTLERNFRPVMPPADARTINQRWQAAARCVDAFHREL
ncbi:MAG: glycerol kinase GlpK [Betaproteobacteria bacterium]|nr:glycerol kinase GlpK [Betaproteobacteria bacterium]